LSLINHNYRSYKYRTPIERLTNQEEQGGAIGCAKCCEQVEGEYNSFDRYYGEYNSLDVLEGLDNVLSRVGPISIG
jgi:hypothetical protein